MRAESTATRVHGTTGVVVVIVLAVLSGCQRQKSASETLLSLASGTERPIEARLTGFDWLAMRKQRPESAGLLDPARLELGGAAGTVIQALANDSSARARHEAGAAYLLIERDRDAVDALESAVQQSPKNARYWSDLAAARYTLAVREKRPHELPQALADADHALSIEPALPDALFNRALIVEALGISEAARRAWQRYAAVDPTTHWADEALRHISSLSVFTTRAKFQQQLDLASQALRIGNDAPIIALARNFPQEARTWSEGPLLGNWGDAVRKGDEKTAAETLLVVRKLGASVAEVNHDQSVADAVAAIDRTAGDPASFRKLADAHAIYRDGRLIYSKRRIAEAEALLRKAAILFGRDDLPMSISTDYYLASCLYDSNRIVEASKAFDQLLTRFDPKRYPATVAEIGWDQTLCQGAAGRWETAIRTASEARKIFASLGETQYRGEMDLLLAGGLNYVSQPAAAWKARVAAFQELSRSGSSDRIRNSLITAIRAETARGRFEPALSLSRIILNDFRQGIQPTAVCFAESERAEIFARIGDLRAARSAVEQARRSAKTIPDIEMRRRTSAEVDIAEGVVARDTRPGQSLKYLEAAIAFFTSDNGNAWLPKAYLERGRTNARAGDDAAALADFKAGLRQVDTQRSSITEKGLRGTFYDAEPDLFSETIALLLRQGETARAFEFADGARARSMYERFGDRPGTSARATLDQLQHSLPPNTVLVEYALLRDSIAVFYVSSSRFGVTLVAATPVGVRSLVERYTDLLQRRGNIEAVQRASGALRQLLIAPVAAELAGAKRLVLVPDRQLHAIPYAALYDATRKRYIIDDIAVSVVPSAASLLLHRAPLTLAPVLVVGDPHDEGAAPLPEAGREAEAIAAMYDSPTLLTGEHATGAHFITAAERSGLIHYAGHAESDSTDPFEALHLASDSTHRSGDLDANAIAALHLDNAPLVILAACGTMRGESEHVEGMPSIARAFLTAGASYVIGTLWEVDDETVSPLFRGIHRQLRNGATPSAALRNAQIALAHDPDPRLCHPATWAPVELLGYSNEKPFSGKERSQ